jgi:hypothetical protein
VKEKQMTLKVAFFMLLAGFLAFFALTIIFVVLEIHTGLAVFSGSISTVCLLIAFSAGQAWEEETKKGSKHA